MPDSVVGQLYSASEMTRICSYRFLGDRWIPLRGDGCGGYDVVVRSFPRGVGSVVFWDHEPDAITHFLASSVPAYIEMWADLLVASYKRNGQRRARSAHPWPFDLTWVRAHDAGAGELLDDSDYGAIVASRD